MGHLSHSHYGQIGLLPTQCPLPPGTQKLILKRQPMIFSCLTDYPLMNILDRKKTFWCSQTKIYHKSYLKGCNKRYFSLSRTWSVCWAFFNVAKDGGVRLEDRECVERGESRESFSLRRIISAARASAWRAASFLAANRASTSILENKCSYFFIEVLGNRRKAELLCFSYIHQDPHFPFLIGEHLLAEGEKQTPETQIARYISKQTGLTPKIFFLLHMYTHP